MYFCIMGVHWGSSVSVVIGGQDGSAKGFLCSPKRPVRLWGLPIPCIMRFGVKADSEWSRPLSSSAEVKNAWGFVSAASYVRLHGVMLNSAQYGRRTLVVFGNGLVSMEVTSVFWSLTKSLCGGIEKSYSQGQTCLDLFSVQWIYVS